MLRFSKKLCISLQNYCVSLAKRLRSPGNLPCNLLFSKASAGRYGLRKKSLIFSQKKSIYDLNRSFPPIKNQSADDKEIVQN